MVLILIKSCHFTLLIFVGDKSTKGVFAVSAEDEESEQEKEWGWKCHVSLEFKTIENEVIDFL